MPFRQLLILFAIFGLLVPVLWGESDPAVEADPAISESEPVADEPSEAATSRTPRVFIVPIHGMINDVRHDHLKRVIEQAREAEADILVLEIDTYGGLVTSALEIASTLKNIDDMRIVAWVNDKAISAGALIALACDEIIMSDRSRIGDCAPISVAPGGGTQPMEGRELEKIETVIREEFRDSARRNGYSEILCEAMVSPGEAVFQVINTETGEVRYLRNSMLPELGLPMRGRPTTGQSAESESIQPVLFKRVNADAADETEEVENPWRVEKMILDDEQLLTMSQDEAIEYGFAIDLKISTLPELIEYLQTTEAQVTRIDPTWSEVLVDFLTSPAIRGFLTIIFLLGIYAELNSPGVGLPGAAAAIALVVLLGAPYLTGMAGSLEIALIVVGVALLFVELLVLPGFGIAGLAGATMILVGLILTFVGMEPGPGVIPSLPQTWEQLRIGGLTIGLSLAISCFGFFLISKYYGSLPLVNRLVLTDAQASGSGSPASGTGAGGHLESIQPGDTGVALSPLKPVGRAQIKDEMVDVVTNDEWVETGASLRVLEVHGNRIVVEEV